VIMSKDKFKVLLVYPNLPLMLVPPLSVAIFTKIIKDLNCSVRLFDTTEYVSDETVSPQNRVKYLQARDFKEEDIGVVGKVDMISDFVGYVESYSPNLIVFVSVVEDVFLKTISMLEAICDFDVPKILGGVFVSAVPEKCMEYGCIDYVGIGEGEGSLSDFICCVRDNGDLKRVNGIWFKDGEKVIKNSPAKPVDINKYPPDFSLFDEKRFYRPMGGRIFKSVPVETFRGCPYHCAYCNSPVTRKLGEFSLKELKKVNVDCDDFPKSFLKRKRLDVVEKNLIEIIEDQNPDLFYFIDDSFLARPADEIFAFCEMYKKIAKPFWFNTRPENCTQENLARLKDVGCYRISFGLECGNESFRKHVLKRKGTNEKIVKWFDVITKSGIPFSINLIIGFPGETRDLVMETVELVRKIKGYDTLTVSIFTPYNGTSLRKVAVKNAWLSDDAITVHTTSSSILKMPKPYLSKDEIDGLMRVVPLYVYFSKDEWGELRKAEKFDSDGEKSFKHYSRIYKEMFMKNSQDDEKEFTFSSSGCKSNMKDEYKFTAIKLTEDEIALLTVKGNI